MKKVLIVSGSNSAPQTSINWKLANFIASNLRKHSAQVTGMFEHSLPMYQQSLESDLPKDVVSFGELVREHDALIIVSPEHNGLMPSCLKNAIDWLSRTRNDGDASFFSATKMPVMLFSTSPGENGGATNLKIMSELMPWWGGEVIGTHSIGNFQDKYQNDMFESETERSIMDHLNYFEQQIG